MAKRKPKGPPPNVAGRPNPEYPVAEARAAAPVDANWLNPSLGFIVGRAVGWSNDSVGSVTVHPPHNGAAVTLEVPCAKALPGSVIRVTDGARSWSFSIEDSDKAVTRYQACVDAHGP